MSAAVRFALVLALVSTVGAGKVWDSYDQQILRLHFTLSFNHIFLSRFTFVKTWPQNNADAELYRQRQRQAASGDSATSAEASGGAIVFPDAKFKPRLTGNKAPECAKGTTFCTEAENYPLPQLSSILQNEINYKEYFGVDKEEAVTDDEIRQRIGPVDGDPLCRSQEKLIFPKIAQNKDDEWMFVVNLDKDYVQGVRIEVCEKEASPCQLSEGFPPGYTTYCRQKYIYRKLLAVGDDGKPAPDSFKLPSCCACYYRKTSIGNRILSANSSAISKPQG
ncbi:protein spaetzle isoform X3 [Anabrus simplex]|uniref:protein spaetzle isoform X3 n=1 Tax=Anabrus simplex TaxID=316456 RepID=UPI0035A28414